MSDKETPARPVTIRPRAHHSLVLADTCLKSSAAPAQVLELIVAAPSGA